MRALLLAAALVAIAAPHAVAQKWSKSTYKQLGFAAEFPSKPSLDSSALSDEDSRTVRTVSAATKVGYFAVVYSDMPEFTAEGIADSTVRRAVLDGAESKSIADAGAELQSRREIALSGRFGREIISTVAEQGMHVYTRIYLEDTRMIMQIAVVELGKNKAMVDRFMKSFKFL